MRATPMGRRLEARRARVISLRSRGWTVGQISAEIGTSRRTTQRDVDHALENAAVDAQQWRQVQINRYVRVWDSLQPGLESEDPGQRAVAARAAVQAPKRLDGITGVDSSTATVGAADTPRQVVPDRLKAIFDRLPRGLLAEA